MRLADPYDQATATSEMMLEHSLAHREPSGPAATGKCLCCEEPLNNERRWCDAECRDEWERISA